MLLGRPLSPQSEPKVGMVEECALVERPMMGRVCLLS